MDLSSTDIIIPENKFDCNESNTCYVQTVDPVTDHQCAMGKIATWNNCTQAKTILRSKQNTKVPKDHAEIFWLNVWLVGKNRDPKATPQSWALGDNGVLGLSPKSSYWEYLRKNFNHGHGDFGIVSLAYKSRGPEHRPLGADPAGSEIRTFLENSLLVINGKLNPTFPDFFMPTDITKDHWSFVDIQLNVDPNLTGEFLSSKLNLLYHTVFRKYKSPETTIIPRGSIVTVCTSKLFYLDNIYDGQNFIY